VVKSRVRADFSVFDLIIDRLSSIDSDTYPVYKGVRLK
jgi:hypothetical protein